MYPDVMSEDLTIDMALGGMSVSRFGDGEIMLMTGRSIPYNEWSQQLQDELIAVAGCTDTGLLKCIPNIYKSHRKAWVQQYEQYGYLFPGSLYGSQFINRPDSAPWTDTDEFRGKVRRLWKDRNVVLVYGTQTGKKKSLTPDMLWDAASVTPVLCEPINAYSSIDSIEERIVSSVAGEQAIVVMCLGPTATVLASRLQKKHSIWSVDLGLIGAFIERTKDSPPLPR